MKPYQKDILDCVANFSNEQLTRARVEAIEADLAKIKAHLGLVEPKEEEKANG